MEYVYLDYSASTPVDPEVVEILSDSLRKFHGNASSVHSLGRRAKETLEDSRQKIADTLHCHHGEIIFTSGGTEADNLAVLGSVRALKDPSKNHIVISAIEHDAVLKPSQYLREHGWDLTLIPPEANGIIDPQKVLHALTEKTCLVSVMYANNETGALQPVEQIAKITQNRGILFHTDAVQVYGKIQLDLSKLPVDLMTISAHKIYGPKGIGALFVRKGTLMNPLLLGGSQEVNRRAGTESVFLTVGFAHAAELMEKYRREDHERHRGMQSFLWERIRDIPGIVLNTPLDSAIPTIVNISFNSSAIPIDGEALIIGLDLRGIYVTSGSACSSGTLQPSHVLLAMGRDEKTAKATVRFSFGRGTTISHLETAAGILHEVHRSLIAKR